MASDIERYKEIADKPLTQDILHLGSNPVFVLGNGPSLAKIDLKAIAVYKTIGMNAAYRHWARIGWRPHQYACLDLVVGLSHIDGIRALILETSEHLPAGVKPISQFLLRQNLIEALGWVADDERVINFDALRLSNTSLQVDPVTTGSHALLWAALQGGDPIVLLGIDGNYVEIVEGAQRRDGIVLEIAEQRANPNYFFEDYQQPGDRYNEPNPKPNLHVSAWQQAASTLEGSIRIVNGNANSEVRCFPFVDAAQLIATGSSIAHSPESLQLLDSPAPQRSRFIAESARLLRNEPLFFLPPAIAALFAAVSWLAGFESLAVLIMSGMVAMVLALQLHFGVRRRPTEKVPSEVVVLLNELTRQTRISRQGNADDRPS